MHTVHQLEADHDSFGRILQPAGLTDLIKSIQCEWAARAVVSELNQQKARKFYDDAVIGQGCAVENVYDAHHFYDMMLSQGLECWHDETFIKEASRDIPDSRIRSKPRNASIIVPATKYTALPSREVAA